MRIGVTRARDRAHSLAEALRTRGADPVLMPTIEGAPPEDWGPLDAGLRSRPEGVAFASSRAVEACGSRADLAEVLAGATVAAVGSATAEALAARGVAVDVVPARFTAEALCGALRDRLGAGLSGMRWLIPRAREGRRVLEEGLREAGAVVEAVVAYRTVVPPAGPVRAAVGEVDAISLASGSAARNLASMVGVEALRGVPLATIGPVTTSACRELGLAVAAEASVARMAGLADAAVAAARGDRR